MRGSTVEKTYQKKTLLEQILLRPDTYIGSTESYQQALWVLDEKTQRFSYEKVNYVPGLYKIFGMLLFP